MSLRLVTNTKSGYDKKQAPSRFERIESKARATDEHIETEEKSVPEKLGPGYWNLIHTMGRKATTPAAQKQFIELVVFIRDSFPCEKCRAHINAWMTDHPFENFLHITDREKGNIGMFKWSWLFHNAVNSRLGKDLIDMDTAWEMYGAEKCHTACAVGETEKALAALPLYTYGK